MSPTSPRSLRRRGSQPAPRPRVRTGIQLELELRSSRRGLEGLDQLRPAPRRRSRACTSSPRRSASCGTATAAIARAQQQPGDELERAGADVLEQRPLARRGACPAPSAHQAPPPARDGARPPRRRAVRAWAGRARSRRHARPHGPRRALPAGRSRPAGRAGDRRRPRRRPSTPGNARSQSRPAPSTCNRSCRPPEEARSFATPPSSTIRPWSTMTIASQRSWTRSSWWLEKRTVRPSRARSRRLSESSETATGRDR